jgi:protein-tyrosine phosphatase
VIDLHSHVLFGIDDGAETIEDSLALARAVADSGVRTLVATPHVSWRYANDADSIASVLGELRERLDSEGVELELLAGAEIAMTQLDQIDASELTRLGLGGGEWLLVEPPFSPVATGLDRIIGALQREGRRVLLAHPERCPAFHRDPAMLRSLVADGALTSLTAGSLAGRFGGSARRFATSLLSDGLAHNVASDAHDLSGRAPGLREEIEQAGFARLSEWLTELVPAAILSGAEIPPRPALGREQGAPKRRWRITR